MADRSAPTGEPEITRKQVERLGAARRLWLSDPLDSGHGLRDLLLAYSGRLLAAALRDVEARERHWYTVADLEAWKKIDAASMPGGG